MSEKKQLNDEELKKELNNEELDKVNGGVRLGDGAGNENANGVLSREKLTYFED